MKIIITRHSSLIEYLKKHGIINDEDYKVIPHANEDDVAGKHVIGVLPIHLAALTESYTTVNMNIPPEMRGKELTLEDMEKYVTGIETYFVLNKHAAKELESFAANGYTGPFFEYPENEE